MKHLLLILFTLMSSAAHADSDPFESLECRAENHVNPAVSKMTLIYSKSSQEGEKIWGKLELTDSATFFGGAYRLGTFSSDRFKFKPMSLIKLGNGVMFFRAVYPDLGNLFFTMVPANNNNYFVTVHLSGDSDPTATLLYCLPVE